MNEILIKNHARKKFLAGYPLIHENDLVIKSDSKKEEWAIFQSEDRQFIGYGYLGKQNKGVGWLVSFDEQQSITDEFIQFLISEAITRRQSFFNSTHTTAFRLFNGEGDGLGGVTMDWYNGYIVISWYNDTILTIKPLLLSILQQLFGDKLLGIYEKNRLNHHDLPETQHVLGVTAPEPLIVLENGVSYATYLNEGLMTGIFLDQKDVRNLLVEGLASGKTVLNTFSYTGAFSAAALMGGASHTTSVDLAKRSLEKTKEMFEINGFDSSSQEIIVMDVFNYFSYAAKKNKTFDVVVLDPPSFARNKKRTFSVAKNYGDLVAEAVQLLNKNGILIASSNAANVPVEKFKQLIDTGIKAQKRRGKQLAFYQLPSDFVVSQTFKEGNYLKVFIYEVN